MVSRRSTESSGSIPLHTNPRHGSVRASSLNTPPLPQDPRHILPLAAVTSSPPRPSPTFSRHRTSLSGRDGEYLTLAGQSSVSSAPKSSTANAWREPRRSGSWSSIDDGEVIHLVGHPKGSSQWWGKDEDGSVSPKLPPANLSRTGRPRHTSVSGGRGTFARILEKTLRIIGVPTPEYSNGSARPRKRSRDRDRDRELDKLTGGGILKRRLDPDQPTSLASLCLEILPRTPIGVVASLLCIIMFAATLTMSLKYVLNPDKAALPWRRYCMPDYPTLYSLQDPLRPHEITGRHADDLVLAPLTHRHPAWPFPGHKKPPYDASMQSDLDLDPVGVYLGVFSMDSAVSRRDMIRQTYGTHWRSRRNGTESVSVRFIMGKPRSEYASAVQREKDKHGDIVILDINENMNSGKTYAYFTWAANNALVPQYVYPAGGDSSAVGMINQAPVKVGTKRPDYIVKADDDAFIMLGELERRLRATPRSKTFWGYLVKNRFMGGECYALSLDLVQYIASTPALRQMTQGKEDVLVSKWLKLHPERESIVWASESCWIYDHPKSGTVYAHGFLFPSEVAAIRKEAAKGLPPGVAAMRGGKEKDAYSSVTKFGTAYRTLVGDMTEGERVEALVEGSPLSQIRDEMIFRAAEQHTSESLRHRISRLYRYRPSRLERFLGDEKERGGTVLVHYIKRPEWFRETALALLGSREE